VGHLVLVPAPFPLSYLNLDLLFQGVVRSAAGAFFFRLFSRSVLGEFFFSCVGVLSSPPLYFSLLRRVVPICTRSGDVGLLAHRPPPTHPLLFPPRCALCLCFSHYFSLTGTLHLTVLFNRALVNRGFGFCDPFGTGPLFRFFPLILEGGAPPDSACLRVPPGT